MEQRKKRGNNQAFDSVNMSPTHRIRSQIKFDYGTREWFPIQKGVTQGCILSSGPFNLYSVTL